jgi:hypothetical protein
VAAAPPFVGPREGDGAARAFLERRTQLGGGERAWPVEPSRMLSAPASASSSGLTGDVLQPGEIGAQVGLAVQVDVEGADVEARRGRGTRSAGS